MGILRKKVWYFWVKGATTDTRTEFYGRES